MSNESAQSAKELIEKLQYHAGPYATYALEARKRYIELRLKQDREIQAMYRRIYDRIAKEVRDLVSNGGSSIRLRQLVEIEKVIAEEIEELNGEVDESLQEYIEEAVDAATSYSKKITIDVLDEVGVDKTPMIRKFSQVNTRSAEAIYARTIDGLSTSDRIWRNSQRAGTAMRDIIQEGVVLGKDVRSVSQALEKYVRNGRQTLAKDYPNMMERVGNRVPQNVSYEALRLARTEMTAAYGEGTIQGSRVSPSATGTRWLLSPSHPVVDICDTFANADNGMGKGVYPVGEEPRFPPHPNCLCVLQPVHENPDDFVEKLRSWLDNPSSQPGIEDWYKNVYKSAS